MRINVASRGVVRVLTERCDTCIFRPGNLMQLQPGRVRDMVREIKKTDGCIPCHKTLDFKEQAICRGQFETVPTAPIQIAERLGCIEETTIEALRGTS